MEGTAAGLAPIGMRAVVSSGAGAVRYVPRAILRGRPGRLHRVSLAMVRHRWRGIVWGQRDIDVLLRDGAETRRRNEGN